MPKDISPMPVVMLVDSTTVIAQPLRPDVNGSFCIKGKGIKKQMGKNKIIIYELRDTHCREKH